MKQFAKESTTVGLWHFEETSGTTNSDSSGNSYTLTDQATGPTRITTADFGGGLSFDGNNDVTERNGGGANLEAALVTVEVLLRVPAPLGGTYGFLVSYEPAGHSFDGRGWSFRLDATGHLAFAVGFGTGAYSPVVDANTCPTDRWIYAAASYDQTTLRLYRCGTLIASSVLAGTISYAASPSAGPGTYKTMVFGANQNNTATYDLFGKADIADCRISNIAKTDAQISVEQATQQYCETEPTTSGIPNFGSGLQVPFSPYQRYKSIRAAIAVYNSVVLGP